VTPTDKLFAALDGLLEAEFRVIEPFLVPWVRREHRLRCRDRALIELAGSYIGRLCSGRAISEEMAKDLGRFRPRSAPETGTRALLLAVLRLNGRKSIGAESIRAVLAGKRNGRRLPGGPAIIGR
jgi:hypothetical protein